jgi:beta-lactamase superfamily II metal-dependent hydrolase
MLSRDPIEAERAARKADQSVPNLSSIMFLAEAEGNTILLTGDGRGDHLLDGLDQAGLLDAEGRLHVDVLKVPHHGSSRNATRAFFQTVTADAYVVSANGRHDNPDLQVLRWIVESAKEQERRIEVFATNATDSTRRLLVECEPEAYGYRLSTMAPGEHSMVLQVS